MGSLTKEAKLVSTELEAHHRLCLEVADLQTELKGLKDGSWKRFQRPDPEEKKTIDVVAVARAEPSKKLRLCACGCGQKRKCNGNDQESMPPLPSALEFTDAPPGADPVMQRAYHEKLAQPRKIREAGDDSSICSRRGSKQVVDPAYLEQLAVPREKARELTKKRRSGPVPKLPDLRGLQAKVIAADERISKPQKPDKPPPFISCPAKPTRSSSTPELQLGRRKPLGMLPPAQCAVLPRPQRRLTAAKPLGLEGLPGLDELRARKLMDAGRFAMSLLPAASSDSPRGCARTAPKKKVRSLDAQQFYIDQFLAAPSAPKGKQEALSMKLEALRNERISREDRRSSYAESEADEVQPLKAEDDIVMPSVNWDLLC